METVLAVSDINFDPALVTDISQLSAEEFLLYVRYEANQCPGVVRAHVDSDQFKGCQTEYMPKVVDIPTCHDMFLPSSEWENEVVDAFSRFRLHLSQLSKDLTTRERRQVVPGMKDESSWFQFCLGGTLAEADGSRDEEAANTAAILESIEDDIALRKNILQATLLEIDEEKETSTGAENESSTKSDSEEKEEGEIMEESAGDKVASLSVEYASAVHPSNQLLLQFDQVLTQRLLAFFSNWLQLPSLHVWNSEYITSADDGVNATPSSQKMYSWIFSLMSRLEKPLYMDASATVRDIYRHLCIQRAELAEKGLAQAETDSHQSDEDVLGPTKRTREASSKSAITSIAQLPASVQKTLAILNTVIVICGKYFGQEEVEVDFAADGGDNSSSCSNSNSSDKNSKAAERSALDAKYTTLVPDEHLYKSDVDNNKNNRDDGDY